MEFVWRKIDHIHELKKARCRHIYALKDKSKDVALIFSGKTFYAMEAWCGHMGGPLYNGDIEDHNGKQYVMCPWHGYMFDLETGRNDIGLKQKTYEVKIEDGQLYIKHDCELSCSPFL